jgi:hypothetical protein
MALTGKTEELEEKPVPVPYCPPQIPQGIHGERPATNRLSHSTATGFFALRNGAVSKQFLFLCSLMALCQSIVCFCFLMALCRGRVYFLCFLMALCRSRVCFCAS